ncbi:MAG: diguanylate cyclase [Gammaproteobacteria bacterium]|nr:diguanylate cyclase [Gammaproteobacteria bacterium]
MTIYNLSQEGIASIIEASPIGMLLVDGEGQIVYLNCRAEEIFKYRRDDLLGNPVEVLIPKASRGGHAHLRKSFVSNPRPRTMGAQGALDGLTRDGDLIPIEVGLSPLEIGDGSHVLVSVLDLSPQRVISLLNCQNQALKQEAMCDALTGLSNRRMLMEQFDRSVFPAMAHQETLTLLYLDLDGFKQVNDTHGHRIGDQLLCEVADTLKKHVRGTDLIVRMGGDEFVVILMGIRKSADALCVADKLERAIAAITTIEDKAVTLGTSIGAVRYSPTAVSGIAEVVHRADQLMYRAKQSGGCRVVYDEELVQPSAGASGHSVQ